MQLQNCKKTENIPFKMIDKKLNIKKLKGNNINNIIILKLKKL
jgi:hypothetical protein